MISKAMDLFGNNHSCTQSLVAGFGEDLGLDRAALLKIGRSFGIGMGLGETCGAVTGALMVLGLGLGPVVDNDLAARTRAYALARELVRRFKERHGTTICRELLGLDPSNPDGLALARERRLFQEICPRFVRTAAELVTEIRSSEVERGSFPGV